MKLEAKNKILFHALKIMKKIKNLINLKLLNPNSLLYLTNFLSTPGTYFTLHVNTWLQMKPSYKVPNYMCNRFNEYKFDVWENIATIYTDFIDLGRIGRKKDPKHLTIQMAVSRQEEKFNNRPTSKCQGGTTIGVLHHDSHWYNAYNHWYELCFDPYCPPANWEKMTWRKEAEQNDYFAYHYYTTNEFNLGVLNASYPDYPKKVDMYERIFKTQGYKFFGYPLVFYPKNALECKFTFSYFTARAASLGKSDDFIASSEYNVMMYTNPLRSGKTYPMVYFKCLYNCGWGHGKSSTGLVYSDYYDIVVMTYKTFYNFLEYGAWHSQFMQGERPQKVKDAELRSQREKKLTPLTKAFWYINGEKDSIHKPFIDYQDPLNANLIFKEEEFMSDESTVVNLQIFSKSIF